VLRHELVHIFNLEQSRFLVPHWYTEGLAVINEGGVRPQSWNQILLRRVPKGDLLNLDTIDLGFMPPRSPEEGSLAYCRSQLCREYIRDRLGDKAVADLLNAYRDGLGTAAALDRVCKVDKESFEQGYRERLQKEVQAMRGRPAEKPLTFAQLQRTYEEKP